MATCQTSHQIYMLLNVMTRRLDDNNFIIWRYQFQTVLEGHDLFGYIDGNTLSPTKYVITDDEGVTDEVSTAYKEWKKTDKAILSLLLATLSFDTMDYVVGSKTSREAWIRLNDRYNTFSKSHVMQLKTDLYTITKGKDSVEIYLLKVTRARNKLDALGVRMEDEDIVVVVLNGLPAEFNLIKAIIRGRNSPIAMHELRILLLAIERDIANRAGLNLPTFSATTTKKNVSQRCLDGNENRSTSRVSYKNNFWSSTQCQICRKKGHTAVCCFYRNIVPPDQPSNFVIICQLCDMKGHTALNCHQRYCAFQEANPPSTLTAMTVDNIIRAASSGDSTFIDGFSSVLHPASTRSPCASLGTHIGVSPAVVDGGGQVAVTDVGKHDILNIHSSDGSDSSRRENIGIVKKKTFQECCTYSHITGQTVFDKYHDATEVKTFEVVANSVRSTADGGVKVGVEAINQYQVMMISVAFLIILFSVRNFGTSKVGLAICPALFIWFCFLGGNGIYNIVQYDSCVLRVLNLAHICYFFKRNSTEAWYSLGGCLPCATGSEGMFTDLCCFVVRFVQHIFVRLILPCLMLGYMGQAAYLMENLNGDDQTFLSSIPSGALWAVFFIANITASMASRVVTTTIVTCIKQPMTLGCFPCLKIMRKTAAMNEEITSRKQETSHRHNEVFFYQGKYAKDLIHIAEKGCKDMIHYLNKFLLHSKQQTFLQKGKILQASRCIPISVF